MSAFFRFSLPFLVASFIAVSRCRLILASRNCYFRFIEDARKGRWVAELKEKEMKPQIDALDAETILREAMELAKAYRLPLNLTEAERRELDILIILLGLNRPERNLTETPFLTEKERAQLTEYLDVMGPRLTPRVNAIAREALALSATSGEVPEYLN